MDTESYRISVEFSEDEVIRLIQFLNKYMVEVQGRDATTETPFESQLIVKLLNKRTAAIMKMKAEARGSLSVLNQV